MLYYIIDYLQRMYDPPGFQMIYFITVRASLAAATALIIALVVGKQIIVWLQRQQIGEQVRAGENAGIVSHAHKEGTPTMGGLIILVSLLGSALLWGDIGEIYVQLALLAIAWMGVFGFIDDYIKVIKKNKEGMAARTKIFGQVTLGVIIGATLYFHPNFAAINTLTNLPFFKDYPLDYYFFRGWVPDLDLGWIIYIPVAILIITAVSNAVNLTDGLDGLTAGTTAFVSLGLATVCYIVGNSIFANFLLVMHLPGAGELTIVAAAMAAACFGFLWYNSYPAEVFMGDTGSLALGAAVGGIALMIRMELLLPILCAVFFAEALSVILQTSYFKYTRKKKGQGVRIFKMAPLHHHYEALGMHESKIVIRFWIITAITVIFTLLSLRIR